MDNFYFLLSFIFYSMATPGTSDWKDKNGIGKGVIGIINDITKGSRDKKTSFEFYQNTIWLLLIPFEIFTIIYFMIYASEQFSFTLIVFSSLLFGLFGYGVRRLLGLPIVVFQILGTAFLILSLANLISFSRFPDKISAAAPINSRDAPDPIPRASNQIEPTTGLNEKTLSVPITAQAQTLIQCDTQSRPPIIIELDAKQKFGVSLHCINADFGDDFQVEGETCAPDGGFGLARPTGSAELGAVVMRWQDTIGHIGHNTEAGVSNTAISFSGGFQSGSDWSNRWNFIVDRISGLGTLELENGPTQPLKEAAIYQCRQVSTKL